jgi:hypothetical protein
VATTTLRYLSYPALAVGISRTSGAGAFTLSTYTELVPVNTITSQFYIAGISLMPPPASATATTNEHIIEVASGLAAAEVMLCQLPYNVRNVSAVGYIPHVAIYLPEPKEVAANTRLSVRTACSVASLTTNGIKLLYQMA